MGSPWQMTAVIVIDDEEHVVPALPTPIDGLVLTDMRPVGEAWWTLTHVRSGLALAAHENVEVLAAVALCLTSVDWTRSGTELRNDPRDIGGMVWLAACEYDALIRSRYHHSAADIGTR